MFTKASDLPFSQQEVFDYHERPGAIDRLIPPWEKVSVVKRNRSLEVGQEVVLQQSIGGIKTKWYARHTVYDPPRHFQDIQEKGPFRSWVHDHAIELLTESTCKLTDSIQYQLPFGFIGQLGRGWIEKKIASMFEYRHKTTLHDLSLVRHLLQFCDLTRRVRIGVSGSSGMLGQRICALASIAGFDVIRIARPETRSVAASVPSSATTILSGDSFSNTEDVEHLDAVIHLGGFGIAESRWTDSIKKKIYSSRVESTERLVNAMKKLRNPPRKFVCASGVGAYGECGDEIRSDSESEHVPIRGKSFLEGVSKSWEFAAAGYSDTGTVSIGRLAMALHPLEGALSKMLPLFKFGLGGRLGKGTQYWSWIHVDDAAGAFLHLALNSESSGVYNLSAPEPKTNSEFTAMLSKKLQRWALLPAPEFGLRIMLGQMADELLLASTRAVPTKLEREAFPFRARTLDQALGLMLP